MTQKDFELLDLQQRYRENGFIIGKLPRDQLYYALDNNTGMQVLPPMPIDAFRRALETIRLF